MDETTPPTDIRQLVEQNYQPGHDSAGLVAKVTAMLATLPEGKLRTGQLGGPARFLAET